eukprot:13717171-Ditylum_brightwellii.AAC.1
MPSAIKYIQKAPTYAACLFSKEQRRAWRTQGNKVKSIRKRCHITSGDGTSTDPIISHQPGLIPHVTSRNTHETFWGTVTMVDHTTNFFYSHLIKDTTMEETVAAKGVYERVLYEYGHTVKSYHGDNS